MTRLNGLRLSGNPSCRPIPVATNMGKMAPGVGIEPTLAVYPS
jgi:hypothetical protein